MGSHGNGANQLSHGDLLISRELIESTLELIADRLVFLCSWTKSASSLTHSFWSFPVCLSPSAARAS